MRTWKRDDSVPAQTVRPAGFAHRCCLTGSRARAIHLRSNAVTCVSNFGESSGTCVFMLSGPKIGAHNPDRTWHAELDDAKSIGHMGSSSGLEGRMSPETSLNVSISSRAARDHTMFHLVPS